MKPFPRILRFHLFVGLCGVQPIAGLFAAVFAGCSKSGTNNIISGPPEVLVTEAIQQDVPVVREWIGSLDGSVDADVRARVSGYLISQNYKEGTVVQQGDLLFQVDPSFYEAAVEQAKAASPSPGEPASNRTDRKTRNPTLRTESRKRTKPR